MLGAVVLGVVGLGLMLGLADRRKAGVQALTEGLGAFFVPEPGGGIVRYGASRSTRQSEVGK